ncbi:hypothetical protein D6855_01415 [Butyrivibrio sp. CB08]|uniref:hypothetical protein n=1 Tax=Butyrivibrio sp. CB08 TaxID=2364879 RepID=UPI000EAA4B74|nr:hypothetical protein [Butyrivibrio sp. CB08]RKM62108.1 hypothetical protein D6855_01415 [Butyrivibrio sp. CB08]
MKKNNVIKDKKVLSALTIGISAMMFLQTPVSAYAANNGELDDTPSNNNTESSESQSESNYEPVTNEAQTEATQAQEACVSQNDVIPATGESPAIGSAQVESQEAANIIVNGDEAKHVEKAGEEFADQQSTPAAITNLVDAAKEVLNDKAEGTDISNIESAAADIAGSEDCAKEQIVVAEEANKAADQAYKDAVSAVDKAGDIMGTTEDDKAPGLIKTQETIDGIVDDTNTKGQEIVNKIANASSEEEIAAAKGELDKLINDSKGDLESQIALFNGLSDSFDKAIDELKAAQDTLDDAEDDYQGALDNAEEKTDDAESKVAIASQKVENLVNAMNDALSAIDELGASADDLARARGSNWEGKFGHANYSDSRDIMKQVIEDYYLTEILGIDLVVDDNHQIEFLNPSGNLEKRFTTVNYYYKENGEIKQGTKYFNWDSIAKTSSAVEDQNLDGNIVSEASTAIVMYEKSELEVKGTVEIAKKLLNSMSDEEKLNYLRNGVFINSNVNAEGKTTNNLSRVPQQGGYRLYSYEDENGKIQYITQFQLRGGYPTGDGSYNDEGDLTLKEKFVKDTRKNGTITYMDGFTKVENPDGTVTYTNPNTGKSYKNLKVVETVTQNQNNLLNDANCLILGDTDVISTVLKGGSYNGVDYSFVKQNVVDKYGISAEKIDELIEANARLNKYIDTNSTAGINNLKDKYNTYATEVVEAQKAVENAQNQVSELSVAIDDLRDKSVKKSKTMIARDALGVNDIATHFGLTGLDEAQAAELNTLTLAGLINRLSELRKDAKDKVDTAKDRLNGVIDVLIANADSASVRPSDGGDDNTPSGGGDTTPAAPATGGGVVATTAAPSTSPILAAVDAAINMDAVQAAGGQGAGAAVQDGQGGAGNVEIADGDVALSETPDAAPVTEAIQETLAEQADIDDQDVALASAMPAAEDAAKMSWWWIFIIAVLGVTGKKMYEEHMRKEEEKNKNKQD